MDLLKNIQVAGPLDCKEELERATKGFFPVPIQNLLIDSKLTFDVHIPVFQPAQKAVQMLKVLSKAEIYDAEKRASLYTKGFDKLFVADEDESDFLNYFSDNLKQVLSNSRIHPREKNELLYESTCRIVEKAFSGKLKEESISQGIRLTRLASKHFSTNKILPAELMDMFAGDYHMVNHCVQVSLLGMAFCRYLGWGNEEVAGFGVGALFHDIGKRGIEDRILNKPCKLDDMELSQIKKHPEFGHRLISSFERITEDQLLMILQHHENIDGTGYPCGLEGLKIHRYARVARIIDSFDAITTNRPYKEALLPVEALEIMLSDMERAFDADLLKAFIKFLGAEECLKGRAQCRRLSIELGTILQLQLKGTDVRFTSRLVGMETGQYLITLLPSIHNLGDQLYKGNEVIIRYMCCGTIYGFRSVVIGYDVHPLRLMFLSYPESIQCHDLRKSPRVCCGFPAKIVVGSKVEIGLIVDISVGGCRFIAQATSESSLQSLQVGEAMTLHFFLLGADAPASFHGIVKNMRHDNKKLEVGIQFVEVGEELEKKIEENIDIVRVLTG